MRGLNFYESDVIKLLLKFYCNKQAKTPHCVLCPGMTGLNAGAVQLTVHILTRSGQILHQKKRTHFVLKIVLTECECFSDQKKFSNLMLKVENFKDFEIITVIFSNSERTEQFFSKECFLFVTEDF